MRIEGDPIPFRAAQAYAVAPNTKVQAVTPVERQQSGARIDAPEVTVAPTKVDRLVGAIVPGKIDFTDAQAKPAPSESVLPFYNKPGQRNEAATSIVANTGRTLDVRG